MEESQWLCSCAEEQEAELTKVQSSKSTKAATLALAKLGRKYNTLLATSERQEEILQLPKSVEMHAWHSCKLTTPVCLKNVTSSNPFTVRKWPAFKLWRWQAKKHLCIPSILHTACLVEQLTSQVLWKLP